MKRTIVFSLVLLAVVACLRPDLESRFTPAWEPFDPVEEGWKTSRPVLLIADPQIHNLYSKPVPERNLSAEAAAATAIRAPQLDMFSPDVLSWIIKNGAPETEAIILLGDALDLACEGEWETFVNVMNGAGKPWFMTPGNHDFYYFGTYDPERLDVWEEACHGAGRPLTKDRFIRTYVDALTAQDDPGCIALAEALGMTEEVGPVSGDGLPLSFDWRAPPDTGGFFEAISWNIDPERPWRSFILQSLNFTGEEIEDFPAHAILMDTCQYGRRPILIPNAWKSYPAGLNCGFSGEMLPNQLRKVREWLETGDSYTLLSHHPFDDYAPRTRSSVGFLWREYAVGMLDVLIRPMNALEALRDVIAPQMAAFLSRSS